MNNTEESSPLMNNLQRLGSRLAIVVGVISGLSTVGGAAWSLLEFAHATRTETRAARVKQVTSYASFGEFLKRYHEIEEVTERFLADYRTKKFDPAEMLTRYKTGSAMYTAPELKDFRAIHQFYEELGTLIRFGAIDFETAFQLITFPSDFFEETRPLHNFLRDNWFALRPDPQQRALSDFGANLTELGNNYAARRQGLPVSWQK